MKLGLGGLTANKSAIYVPVTIGTAQILVVGCHLSAHSQNVEGRNQQFSEIFGLDVKNDYEFIMGDMNYRIEMDYEDAINLALSEEFDTLLQQDQLKNSQSREEVMRTFKESEIQFKPTYKYDLNKDIYDSSPKRRVPSYTDRILYRTGEKRLTVGLQDFLFFETDVFRNWVDQNQFFETLDFSKPPPFKSNFPAPPHCITYHSINNHFSDHQPVYALYNIQVPFEDDRRLSLLLKIIEAKFVELKKLSCPFLSFDPPSLGLNGGVIKMYSQSNCWIKWTANTFPEGLTITPSSGTLFAFSSVSLCINVDTPLSKEDDIFFSTSDGQLFQFKLK